MTDTMNRRGCIKRCAGIAAASGMFESDALAAESESAPLNVYFGDLHNHNSVGYGLGSPERAFEIAKSHLDFLCFTPHAYYDTSAQSEMMKNWTGYEKITHDRWPDVLALNREYYQPGEFVTFPGYERHSSTVGHYCIVFPGGDPPLEYFGELKDFQRHAREMGAILVPHHPGYIEGTAGADPTHWDPSVSPLLEMFSEHGCAECDTAPVDYIRHSMGPRVTRHTMQGFLEQGYRFWIVASTDDHLGFPGAYGEGKAAVLAAELTRRAVFGALGKRRCYGVSGDRIELDFRVNGRLMGEELPYAAKRTITAAVRGWDAVDRIEVLKNNRVVHREIPCDLDPGAGLWDRPVTLRIEYGWGPMAENQIPLDRIPDIFDWDFKVTLAGAKMLDLQPCWQSAPLDEGRRHRLSNRTAAGFSLRSYTSRQRCLFNRDTHVMAMRIQASPRDSVTIDITEPEKKSLTVRFSDLLGGDEAVRVGRNSIKLHRIFPEINTVSRFSFVDDSPGDRADWYYLRVAQKNGQFAWSSPVWVEKKK